MRLFYLSLILFFVACNQSNNSSSNQSESSADATPVSTAVADADYNSVAYFASGCFWCVEGVFESVKGIGDVVSGYAGGNTKNPTYYEVGSGKTGHAEAVKIPYDASVIDYSTLLKVYFNSMDPTQVNGQGPDQGSAYRSIIFYQSEQEKELAESMIKALNESGKYNKPIAVEVKAFDKFWPAEDYHQDYIEHNPGNPYVQHESIPRIKRFQKQFPDLIKPEKKRIEN